MPWSSVRIQLKHITAVIDRDDPANGVFWKLVVVTLIIAETRAIQISKHIVFIQRRILISYQATDNKQSFSDLNSFVFSLFVRENKWIDKNSNECSKKEPQTQTSLSCNDQRTSVSAERSNARFNVYYNSFLLKIFGKQPIETTYMKKVLFAKNDSPTRITRFINYRMA